jgi:hypothetical protein
MKVAIFLNITYHMRICGLLMVLLTLASCKNVRQDSEEGERKTSQNNPLFYIEDRIILADAFADGPMDDLSNFRDKYKDFTMTKEVFSVQGEPDTVFTFAKGKDTVKIYHTPTELGLSKLALTTSQIKLKRGIKNGMTKRDFYKAFEPLDTVRNQRDKITIMGSEESLEFLFRQDTLSVIRFGTRVH